MSKAEALFCRSAPWQAIAGHVVLPWAEGDAVIGPRVLEIGAGSGAMADRLLNRHPEIDRLVALDIDPAMVTAAARRLRDFGDRAEATVGDGVTLPLPDGCFDTVCSWLMLHHTLDWRATLAEATRVLAPSGVLVGYDLHDRRLGRALHGISRSEVHLLERSELAGALDDLGFVDVRVEPAVANQFFRFYARRRGAGGALDSDQSTGLRSSRQAMRSNP